MHVEIHGLRYPISNDFDPDHGQWWAWDLGVPECPQCGDALNERDGSRLAWVSPVEWYSDDVVCPCGARFRIQE